MWTVDIEPAERQTHTMATTATAATASARQRRRRRTAAGKTSFKMESRRRPDDAAVVATGMSQSTQNDAHEQRVVPQAVAGLRGRGGARQLPTRVDAAVAVARLVARAAVALAARDARAGAVVGPATRGRGRGGGVDAGRGRAVERNEGVSRSGSVHLQSQKGWREWMRLRRGVVCGCDTGVKIWGASVRAGYY